MATHIIFTDEFGSKELECFATEANKIDISIYIKDDSGLFITIDKQTAIKLSKVLKSEISKLK